MVINNSVLIQWGIFIFDRGNIWYYQTFPTTYTSFYTLSATITKIVNTDMAGANPSTWQKAKSNLSTFVIGNLGLLSGNFDWAVSWISIGI